MRYEKLNIEITNEHYFDNIIQYNDVIELYSNNILKFKVYRNSGVCAYNSSLIDVYGSSRVSAYDKSTVNAYVESIVNAYGGSIIYARDSSTIGANGSSTVCAYDNSKVYAYYKSIIYAYDSSTISAYDKSTVYAYCKSTVDANEFSMVYIYNFKVKIKTENHFGAIIKQVFNIKEDILVYKKLQDDMIATLKLVKGQTFQSERFDKCRTDKALVVEITDIINTEKYQSGVSSYDENFIYEVGKEVIADKYDENIEECSGGIHFFLTREKAEEYKL